MFRVEYEDYHWKDESEHSTVVVKHDRCDYPWSFSNYPEAKDFIESEKPKHDMRLYYIQRV